MSHSPPTGVEHARPQASTARPRTAGGLALLLVLLAVTDAGGHPALELDGGLHPGAPFAGRTIPSGAQAAYFNPALLIEGAGFEVSLLGHYHRLSIDLLERPADFDVAESITRARIVEGDKTLRPTLRPLPTEQLRAPRGGADPLDRAAWWKVGTVIPLLQGRLAFGALALLPLGSSLQAQRPFYVDEREQYFSNSLHFELYGDRLSGMGATLGVGWAPWSRLALGAGISVLNHAVTRAEVYIPDAADQSRVETNPEVVVETRLRPNLGALVRPLGDETLQLTATLHPQAGNTVQGVSELQFWDYDYPDGENALVQSFELAYGFEPLRLGGGISAALGDDRLRHRPYLEAVWSRWSAYRNRHDELAAGWSDTLSLAVGAQLEAAEHRLALGLRWAPSPVPAQEGRTNYVDNDRVGAQLGWMWSGSWLDTSVALGISLQAQRLLHRSQVKQPGVQQPVLDEFPAAVDVQSGETVRESAGLQTNNPGFPGYSSEGWVLGAQLVLKVQG